MYSLSSKSRFHINAKIENNLLIYMYSLSSESCFERSSTPSVPSSRDSARDGIVVPWVPCTLSVLSELSSLSLLSSPFSIKNKLYG